MPNRPADRAVTGGSLALHGGPPVRDKLLPYGHHTIEGEDIAAVINVLESDWITQGPKVEEFEQAVADYCGARFGVAFSSGTAALHAACAVGGLRSGDEAITTPLTFVATANAVVYCGAKPVFADVRADTLNINPAEIERFVTGKTKAILPVDFAGQPTDLEEILSLARKYNLIVIEDGCHALGARYKGQRIGSVSDMTVFSFHPVKHITTGEGGAVTTNNPEWPRRLRMFRNHGIDRDARQREQEGLWEYEVTDLGYNYRLTDLASGLGLSQLRRLEANLARRREIASRYNKAFRSTMGLILPQVCGDVGPAWHLYAIRLVPELLTADRDTFLRALRAEGVGATVHYMPVHLHPYYQKRFGYGGGEYPVAERAYRELVSLPIFHGMKDQDVEDVIEAVNKVLGYYSA